MVFSNQILRKVKIAKGKKVKIFAKDIIIVQTVGLHNKVTFILVLICSFTAALQLNHQLPSV